MSRSKVAAEPDSAVQLGGHVSSKPSRNRVSFRMQRLEPQVALALGAYTLWVGVFLHPWAPEVWLVALYAAAIGSWARAYPPRRVVHMVARAGLLLCGAFVLHTTPELEGPASLWLVWPLTIAVSYCLLLPARLGAGLIVLTLLEFFAACVVVQPRWQLALATAGALWFLPAMARVFGRSLRSADRKAEQSQLDRRTQLYNEDGFLANGGVLFEQCKRDKRPLSLVLLSAADLRDASQLLGKRAANKLLTQMISGIAAITPPDALAARTDAVEFALVLPGLTAERAEALVQQQLGRPPQLEIAGDDQTVTIVLDMMVAQAASDVQSLDDLYDRLHFRMPSRHNASTRASSDQPSTMQGLLPLEDQIPYALRPTLPMPLNPQP
jgi:GGDEF domain-containing protein